MRDEIARLRREAERVIAESPTPAVLEEARRVYLGRRGKLAALFEMLGRAPEAERRALGQALNETREALLAQFTRQAEYLERHVLADRLLAERIDMTLPGHQRHLGRPHVLRRALEQAQQIFIRMGFEVVDGAEVETEEYNFERLNIPPDHPARDEQDSFYLGDDLLLRTQSTAVDARIMRERRPPMRVLTAGRCYRRDVVDATHMPVFHQVDGFMVGERITFADLKGVLGQFAREMFGPQTRTRFQPSYFPFTEPSAEVAVEFSGGWMELGGCGMFHPRVLEMGGIDPERYTAFAFGGFGDRVVMARYGITDIRLFWENDLRMLEQF